MLSVCLPSKEQQDHVAVAAFAHPIESEDFERCCCGFRKNLLPTPSCVM